VESAEAVNLLVYLQIKEHQSHKQTKAQRQIGAEQAIEERIGPETASDQERVGA
jgi:hypothetical protein